MFNNHKTQKSMKTITLDAISVIDENLAEVYKSFKSGEVHESFCAYNVGGESNGNILGERYPLFERVGNCVRLYDDLENYERERGKAFIDEIEDTTDKALELEDKLNDKFGEWAEEGFGLKSPFGTIYIQFGEEDSTEIVIDEYDKTIKVDDLGFFEKSMLAKVVLSITTQDGMSNYFFTDVEKGLSFRVNFEVSDEEVMAVHYLAEKLTGAKLKIENKKKETLLV